MAKKMAKKPKYRLRLKSLDFISAVDTPAQETATVLLTKRKGAERLDVTGTFAVAKLNEQLGLVFGYGFTSTDNGAAYFDLHGDQIISDDQMIKVALQFAEAGAAADEMHDEIATGTIPFLMPMTADIAKAFGIEGAETGLMIGMKPAPDVFAKFIAGDLTGFSIQGTGEREAVKGGPSPTYSKRGQLTTATDGHAHLVDDEGTSGHTSWEGEPKSHSHPYVIDDAGNITIGEAQGHKHKVATGKRAPISTPAKPAEIDMDELEKLKKALAHATAYGALTDAEKAYHATLDESEKESFVAKSATDRADVLKQKADEDPVVYKALDGSVFRKSDDARICEAVKRADAATKNAIARESIAKRAEFSKRAEAELGHMAGDEAVKVAFLEAVESIPEEHRDGVVTMVKAANDSLAKMFETVGHAAGATDDSSAETKLQKLAEDRASAESTSFEQAYAKVLDSPEGRKLYKQTLAN